MKRKGDTAAEKLFRFDQAYSKKYRSPLIKWYQTDMSPEDKYRLGLMTVPEYEEWQRKLAEEKAASEASSGATFWSGDTEDRETISQSDYNSFLADNNLNVSNSASVDVEALLNEHGKDAAPPEPDMDEILANVNRDIHGGDTVLSEDEIAALFAAAQNGGN